MPEEKRQLIGEHHLLLAFRGSDAVPSFLIQPQQDGPAARRRRLQARYHLGRLPGFNVGIVHARNRVSSERRIVNFSAPDLASGFSGEDMGSLLSLRKNCQSARIA